MAQKTQLKKDDLKTARGRNNRLRALLANEWNDLKIVSIKRTGLGWVVSYNES